MAGQARWNAIKVAVLAHSRSLRRGMQPGEVGARDYRAARRSETLRVNAESIQRDGDPGALEPATRPGRSSW